MKGFSAAFSCEAIKAFRSKILWLSMAAFFMVPLAGGLFMFILKNPELAKSSSLISAKANLVGIADWPSYFHFLAQGVTVGGLFVFGFVTSWVFGREYSDRTLKDLLALPIPRGSIVAAKFAVIFIWCLFLSLMVFGAGVLVGRTIVLPGWNTGIVNQNFVNFIICTVLTIALSTPVAFLAAAGRGYLSPLGFVVFTLVLANVIAELGYGEFFPWSIPALFSGAAGTAAYRPGIPSMIILVLTSLAGLIATGMWWRYADES